MSSWRRKILTLFPTLRFDAQQPNYTIYTAFFDLLPMSRKAHKAGDDETLRRIYGFAEWCFEQPAKDLWNAAGVSFYEHLFDEYPSLWPEIVQWLSPRVVKEVWPLLEWRLKVDELARVQDLIARRRRIRYPEARFNPREFNSSAHKLT